MPGKYVEKKLDMAEKNNPVLYEKEALTFEQQADRLLERGLIAKRDELIQRLKAVSYYRLSGYLHPFREPEADNFKKDTNPGQKLRY